jgi:hypothetical protein
MEKQASAGEKKGADTNEAVKDVLRYILDEENKRTQHNNHHYFGQ